jgi:hypothetical protein
MINSQEVKAKIELEYIENTAGCVCKLGTNCPGRLYYVPGMDNVKACELCSYSIAEDGSSVFLPHHPEFDPENPFFN